jgi:hypothetical protein
LLGSSKYFERTERVEFIDAIEDHDVDQHALSVRVSSVASVAMAFQVRTIRRRVSRWLECLRVVRIS